MELIKEALLYIWWFVVLCAALDPVICLVWSLAKHYGGITISTRSIITSEMAIAFVLLWTFKDFFVP